MIRSTLPNPSLHKQPGSNPRPPSWAEELAIKYQSNIAHAFLVHGNVQDYVGGLAGHTLKNYLIASFSERDLVVCWDRASGFTLPSAKMRQTFVELAGIPILGRPSEGSTLPPGQGGLSGGLNQVATTSAIGDLATILGKIRQPEDALDALNRVLHARPSRSPEEETPFRVAAILDYAESVAPATEAAASEIDRTALVTLTSWGHVRAIGDHGHILIMIVNELHDLNERLRRSSARWERIEVPFPSLEERALFIQSLTSDPDTNLASDMTSEEMARLTTGLRYIDLEDIVLRASFQGQAIDRTLIKQRKDEIMSSEFGDVLHIAEHEFGFDSLGGMQEVKQDLFGTVVVPMRTGDLRMVPQGLLLMGPAGTGKTRLAKALAKEAGVTFVELQLDKMYSRWGGDTERHLERALEAIVAWRPCIVFIDEIDQVLSRGESGDSGVSNRVFKRLLEAMSDTSLRGHVLYVGATNRPDLLDSAMQRPGRLDKKIPILAPDADERAAILEVLTSTAFQSVVPNDVPTREEYAALAKTMEGYTGAEIEGVVVKAMQIRAHDPQVTILRALQLAYDKIIPSMQDVELMTRLALLYCNDLDLVPAQQRALARQLRHPQARAELLEAQDPPEPPQRRLRRRDW